MEIVDAAVLVASVAAVAIGTLRWFRVAQREHYLPGEATLFALRWWTSAPDNQGLAIAGAAGAVAAIFLSAIAVVPAAVGVFGPRRLDLRGRTSRLAWTRRMTTVAVVTYLVDAIAFAAGAIGDGLAGAVIAGAFASMLEPCVVDVALALTRPAEELAARRHVARARARLEKVRPLVIGVTGSYGKTTTKGYIAHLISGYRTTLASPKSFNNRAGLARTVNEHLGPATEVLIAEMGTYGPGEIAEMCSWLRPEISVITAIGPAHLQRFKTLDRTLAAKAEIAATARVVVLNVDDSLLAGLAPVLRGAGKTVVEASGSNEVADVAVLPVAEGLELRIDGHRVGIASVSLADQPTATSNVACAVAVAIELGIAAEDLLARLPSLPVPSNRLQRYVARDGYVVFDDTFNSNPIGARIALARLRQEESVAEQARRVVVTPGMVELGELQATENATLGESASRVADHLVVVARTNRAALTSGAARVEGGAYVTTVDRLDQALDWVRTNLGPGDAVLYENDLPDHFP